MNVDNRKPCVKKRNNQKCTDMLLNWEQELGIYTVQPLCQNRVIFVLIFDCKYKTTQRPLDWQWYQQEMAINYFFLARLTSAEMWIWLFLIRPSITNSSFRVLGQIRSTFLSLKMKSAVPSHRSDRESMFLGAAWILITLRDDVHCNE